MAQKRLAEIRRLVLLQILAAGHGLCVQALAEPSQADRGWESSNAFRALLTVDSRGRTRSNSPASVEIDFQEALRSQGARESFDEESAEIFALAVPSRRVPHRIDRLFGASRMTVHFVVPDHHCTNFAVYFDTVESRRGQPRRFGGLIGDGEKFMERFQRREIAASHFDQFVDFDGDGDLDLFKRVVEPFVHCFENIEGNRLVDRGHLASDGHVFKLPCSRSNRSWVTVAFFDLDGNGDLDLLTGQGHGGSGLRFYERDWLEDEPHGTPPVVEVLSVETNPARRQLNRSR